MLPLVAAGLVLNAHAQPTTTPTVAATCSHSSFAGVSSIDCTNVYDLSTAPWPPSMAYNGNLNLANNHISIVASNSFSSYPYAAQTEVLFMYGNQITYIEANAFADFTVLMVLDLAENDIEQMAENSLAGLSQLEELELRTNKIEYFHYGVLATLTNLTKLKLGDQMTQGANTWKCDGEDDFDTPEKIAQAISNCSANPCSNSFVACSSTGTIATTTTTTTTTMATTTTTTTTASTTPTTTITVTEAPTTVAPDPQTDGGISTGEIVGIAFGSLVFVGLAVGIAT